MTLRTNSKVAGYAFLVYIAAAMSGLILASRAASGEGVAAKLASIAQHAPQMRLAIVLQMVGCFCALVLAVTLWAITRDEDPDLALLAATFRIAEGVIGVSSMELMAERLWLATTANRPDPATTEVLGTYLFKLPESASVPAICFAVGSTIFAYLMLRGRIVPVALAWLGLLASILAMVVLPLEMVGLVGSPISEAKWLPLLVFEVWLALRLIIKGAAMPSPRAAAR
jgi:Domain of unknown function (DUF4386)